MHSASTAKVPGDVYNLKTVLVLLRCLRHHISLPAVDSLAGVKQDGSEVHLCLGGCEVAVSGWELVAGAVKQNMLFSLMVFLTKNRERESILCDYYHILMS